MPRINAITSNTPAKHNQLPINLTLSEIDHYKQRFIESNLTLSAAEFAALFGKEVKWALERMRDGSVAVLDEFAKITADGIKFSKSARVTAESVRTFRDTLLVSGVQN